MNLVEEAMELCYKRKSRVLLRHYVGLTTYESVRHLISVDHRGIGWRQTIA